jgi:MOSC domain-containing protein YiiM
MTRPMNNRSAKADPTRVTPAVVGSALADRLFPAPAREGRRVSGVLVQLNISSGGMPKLPLPTARVTRDGVAGDWQKVRKYHGGSDRAVCLFSEELYAWLREQGVNDVVNGSIGENLTTRGIELMSLNVGDRLRVGDECVIELTDVRAPCRQLRMWDERFPKLIVARSGWLARVVVEGEVKAVDPIVVLERGAA